MMTRRHIWLKDDGDGIPEENEIKGNNLRLLQANYLTAFDTLLLNNKNN